jgi:hypothetical protein
MVTASTHTRDDHLRFASLRQTQYPDSSELENHKNMIVDKSVVETKTNDLHITNNRIRTAAWFPHRLTELRKFR